MRISCPSKRVSLLLCASAFLSAAPAAALRFSDPGFRSETLAVLPASQPVGLAWGPGGRIFIWQKDGLVRILKDGALLPTPFIDIRDHVNTAHDRGMMGLALDPDFAANGYVYLFYTFEPGGGAASSDGGPRNGRLTRVQADPADPDRALPGSETPILGKQEGPCSQSPAGSDCISTDVDSHGVGTLLFAPDGKLFASIGDGADYNQPDSLSFRSQDLDRYEGKLLRLNPDGSAPGDNPFDDGTQSIRSLIYAYGLRNPFRFGLDASGEPYIGDVGSNLFEEIDRGRGANFGWPCWEGNGPNWRRVDVLGVENCRKLDSTVSVPVKPVFTYGRESGTSVIGGDFNPGISFPDSMRGDFFFGDWGTDKLMRLRLDTAGRAIAATEFAGEAGRPVFLRFGPDGLLYYVANSDRGSAEIRRIAFTGAQSAIHGPRRRHSVPNPVAFPLFDGTGRLRGRIEAPNPPGRPGIGRWGTPVFPEK
ncbi:MAG: PQQ-dependent sugar dehydrogenase [Fibrobacteria bacterium]